jgi:hypothetical protein
VPARGLETDRGLSRPPAIGSNSAMPWGGAAGLRNRRVVGRVRARAAMAVALAACGAVPVAAEVTDRVNRRIALPAGALVTLDASMATVRVIGADRDDVAIEVVRSAPEAADLIRFPVVVDESGGRLRVSVVQAGTDARLQATIRLEVPRTVRIERLHVAEGRLDVTDLAGALSADVRRGPIHAQRVSGTLRLETGIGDVTVEQARLTPDGLIRLRAFNGNVRLVFAETPADARVMALALNGTVTSPQIALAARTGWGPRWAEATLGRGEPVVSLDVVSGDIRIEAPAR